MKEYPMSDTTSTRREALEAELAAIDADPREYLPFPAPAPDTTGKLILHTQTPEERAFVERVSIFELDGRDYTIEKRPRINVALAYLRLARTQGDNAAIGYLLEESLGKDAFQALTEYDGLSADEFGQIFAIVQKHVLGGLEGPKGR
jgi:hypothetical protein